MKRVIAVALTSACVTVTSSVAIPTDNPLSAPLDRAVGQAAVGFMVGRCHVGLSIVVRARRQTHFYDYGTVSRDRVELPRAESVYELASVTKTFIGALAAKALAEHKMLLDGDFRAYLPNIYPNLEAGGHPITLRSLATHTSGMQRDLPDSDAVMGRQDYDHIGYELAALDEGFTEAKSLLALHGVTLRSEPGARFVYSNIGIRVIGYSLAEVYHTSLPHLLAQDIFEPLGMTETSFEPTRAMRVRQVTPYSRLGTCKRIMMQMLARPTGFMRHRVIWRGIWRGSSMNMTLSLRERTR
jgi:serine-type D-Ala-D-Ala carboxypeptidase/endopeptidase